MPRNGVHGGPVFRMRTERHRPAVRELLEELALRLGACAALRREERRLDLHAPATRGHGPDGERHPGSAAESGKRHGARRELGYGIQEPNRIRTHPLLRVVPENEDRLTASEQTDG